MKRVMSLYEFLERLEKDPFDKELDELTKNDFQVVCPDKKEPSNERIS